MRTSKKTFFWAIMVFVIFLVLSFVMEFSQGHSNDAPNAINHLEFYINLAIGICASALLVMLSALSSYFVQKRETGNAIFLASVEYIFDYCLFCDRYELTRIDTLNSSERLTLIRDIAELQKERQRVVLSSSYFHSFVNCSQMMSDLRDLKSTLDTLHISIGLIQKAVMIPQENAAEKFDHAIANLRGMHPAKEKADKILDSIRIQNKISIN